MCECVCVTCFTCICYIESTRTFGSDWETRGNKIWIKPTNSAFDNETGIKQQAKKKATLVKYIIKTFFKVGESKVHTRMHTEMKWGNSLPTHILNTLLIKKKNFCFLLYFLFRCLWSYPLLLFNSINHKECKKTSFHDFCLLPWWMKNNFILERRTVKHVARMQTNTKKAHRN